MGPGARSSILLDRLCAISLAHVASLSIFMMWEAQHRCGYSGQEASRRMAGHIAHRYGAHGMNVPAAAQLSEPRRLSRHTMLLCNTRPAQGQHLAHLNEKQKAHPRSVRWCGSRASRQELEDSSCAAG